MSYKLFKGASISYGEPTTITSDSVLEVANFNLSFEKIKSITHILSVAYDEEIGKLPSLSLK